MKKIISFIILLIAISGCIGGPTNDTNKTGTPDNLNLTENIDTTMEEIISQSESNMSNHSGTYESTYFYKFNFSKDSKYMMIEFEDSTREIYYEGGNQTFVRNKRGTNTTLSESPPLTFSTVYDLVRSEINTTQMKINLEKTDELDYKGTYNYKNSSGEIDIKVNRNGTIKEMKINKSKAIENDIKLSVTRTNGIQIDEPSWVQDIRDKRIDPDEIESVTGSVSFEQNDDSVRVTLESLSGGESAIVVSDTGNVEFPQGKTLTVGEEIRVENVKTGEIILVRGLKPNGSTWSIDLYIAN